MASDLPAGTRSELASDDDEEMGEYINETLSDTTEPEAFAARCFVSDSVRRQPESPIPVNEQYI
jgi:hypothetical protein